MWAAIKIAFKYGDAEKVVMIILVCFFGALILIGLLFSAPMAVFKYIPMGQTPDEFGYYKKGALKIEQETGILIWWQKIMAIDAVVLEQDFTFSSEQRAYNYKPFFIYEEIVPFPCPGPADENGNATVATCFRKLFFERDYNDVLRLLVLNGIIKEDQIQDVLDYTIIDASPLADEGMPLPPGWMPIIRDFNWPLPGIYRVTSVFGPRTDPVYFEPAMHNGMDIGAATGTDVLAAKEGKVIYAKRMGNAGNAVIIQHDNDTQTCYFHLSKISVKAGKEVSKDQKIGEVGDTGKSTAPHLHFEFRVGGMPVNPLQYYQ